MLHHYFWLGLLAGCRFSSKILAIVEQWHFHCLVIVSHNCVAPPRQTQLNSTVRYDLLWDCQVCFVPSAPSDILSFAPTPNFRVGCWRPTWLDLAHDRILSSEWEKFKWKDCETKQLASSLPHAPSCGSWWYLYGMQYDNNRTNNSRCICTNIKRFFK